MFVFNAEDVSNGADLSIVAVEDNHCWFSEFFRTKPKVDEVGTRGTHKIGSIEIPEFKALYTPGLVYPLWEWDNEPPVCYRKLVSVRRVHIQDVEPDDINAMGIKSGVDVGPFDVGFNEWEEERRILRDLWNWKAAEGHKWSDNPEVWLLEWGKAD